MSDYEEQPAYKFDWEVLLDATLTFSDSNQLNNVKDSASDNNVVSSGSNISSAHVRTVKCFFSRVYLQDYELIDMGADEQMTDHLNAKKRGYEIKDEEKRKLEMRKMRKRCKTFIRKLDDLDFVHGYGLPIKKEESEHKLTCYMDLEHFDDASYITYESQFKPHAQHKHEGTYHSASFITTTLTDVSIEAGNEGTETSTSDESLIRQAPPEDRNYVADAFEELDISENKLDFDFSFNEQRDAKLIAKNANTVFRNDQAIKKYWFQRYRLFSRLTEGILMDREGWWSVTPETIAMHVADRLVKEQDTVILDAFTGVGGNAIQFALRGAYVIAVDMDPVKLRCAARNAEIYGVKDRINFICGDFFDVAQTGSRNRGKNDRELGLWENPYGIDAVFLRPSWRGPSYKKKEIFDLEKHVNPDGIKIFNVARKISPNIAYFLPKNTSVKQLISLAGAGNQVEIEQSVLNTKIKAIHAYYGNLIAT